MIPHELDELLQETLEDEVLSRRERRSVRDLAASSALSSNQQLELQNRVFVLAQNKVTDAPEKVLSWVENVMKAINSPNTSDTSTQSVAEARFSPGDECLHMLLRHLEQTRNSADICVFTITDNRLAKAIHALHQRGVQVRIISDNDKSLDRGSDVDRLAESGIAVRFDRTEHHMHHKYALFDNQTLITGSYNWTRSAAAYNHENLVVSSEPRLLNAFQRNFEELWSHLA